eukprot:gnl/Chilomastix_caulleri/5250.p1 GENE.gnl/Chilomastix_caulleri/5250~~gnl/Chilomastix_caulleri/5250.p1  ORF type:complete len:56 (-),score=8.58 gnl/Chilomastix_caulleri/5250:44-211(-)
MCSRFEIGLDNASLRLLNPQHICQPIQTSPPIISSGISCQTASLPAGVLRWLVGS